MAISSSYNQTIIKKYIQIIIVTAIGETIGKLSVETLWRQNKIKNIISQFISIINLHLYRNSYKAEFLTLE